MSKIEEFMAQDEAFATAHEDLMALCDQLRDLAEAISTNPETVAIAATREDGPKTAIFPSRRFSAETMPTAEALNRAMRQRFEARERRDSAYAALSPAEQV